MKLKALLALVLTIVSVGALAQAEDPVLRKEMEAFFARFDRLMAAGKTNELFDLLAPDYTHVDTQGKRMDRGAFKASIRGWANVAKDIRSKTTVKHVRGSGNEAIAWCEEVYTYKMRTESGGWTAMKSTSRFAESLRKTPNGWVFYYSQQLPLNEPWSFKTGN